MIHKQLRITNPPDYVDVNIYKKAGKSKLSGYIKKLVRKYFTANIWYAKSSEKNDILIATAAKKKVDMFFLVYVKMHCPTIKLEDCPVRMSYEIHRPLTKFDLHNKLFFWAKLFHDYMVNTKKIPDDSVKYIQEENYKFVESKESLLIITIESINKT